MKKSFLIIVGLAAMLLFAPACLEDFFLQMKKKT